MNVLVEILITIILGSVVAYIMYKFYLFALSPVKLCKAARIWTILEICGSCPEIEQTVDGVMWLSQQGVLNSEILILDCGMDSETRELAEFVILKYSNIHLCNSNELEMLWETANESKN